MARCRICDEPAREPSTEICTICAHRTTAAERRVYRRALTAGVIDTA